MPRIAPDLYDQIVWPLTETSGPYRNVGQYSPNNSLTDLSITNTITRVSSGVVLSNCPQIPGTSNVPSGSSATRNYIAGAQTVNFQPPITLSCWVYLRSYTSVNNTTFVGKEYRDSTITSSWSTPFHAINISTYTGNGGGDWGADIAVNSSTNATFTVTDFPIPLGVWSHVGVTYDGTNMRVYLNGCQMMYYSGSTQLMTRAAASISYTDGTNGFGFWRVGAITATGSASKQEPNCSVQDVRLASVVRPLSYFKRIYSAGALPTVSGQSVNAQYYKLRAYDISCSIPVTWVDTQVSLANAPAFPCSGPYSSPEVLDTWYA
jgi:hypothetical protein